MVLSDGKFKIKKPSDLMSEAGWLLLPHSRRVMDLPQVWAPPLWSTYSKSPHLLVLYWGGELTM